MMDHRTAKELVHVRAWPARVDAIVQRGRAAYMADELLQEAGDSLMMKLGEPATRLARLKAPEPDVVEWRVAVANRNVLIHRYDEINRELTWLTLYRDLREWNTTLEPEFATATRLVQAQRREAEADDDVAAGSFTEHEGIHSMLDSLDS